MRCTGLIVVASTLLVACGGTSAGSTTGEAGAPADTGATFEVASTAYPLAAGAETYRCWSSKTPAEAILQLTEMSVDVPKVGVHHWAMFTNSAPVPQDPSGYDCADMSATWGLVAAGGVGTPAPKFPDGTAMKVKPNQHVVFQLHLLNTTGSDLDIAPVTLKMIGAPAAQSLLPVGLLISGTLDLKLPAQSKDVQIVGGCATKFPLEHVFAVFPHMHQLGKRITTEIVPAGGSAQMLSDIPWNFSDQGLYPAIGAVAQGDRVKVTCHFDNPTSKEVDFGEGSHDEMCLSVLFHYPAPDGPSSHYCGLADDM